MGVLYMSKKLFRKMVTPVVATVTFVQTGNYVHAEVPTNIQEDPKYLDTEGEYNYPLKVFCEKCGWTDCKTSKECLAKVKEKLNLDVNEKVLVGWYDYKPTDALFGAEKYYSLFIDVESCGKSTSGKNVNIILPPENFVELEDELYEASQLLEVEEWQTNELKDTIKFYAKQVKEMKLKKYLKIGAGIAISAMVLIPLIAVVASNANNGSVKQKRFASKKSYANYQQDDYDEYDENEDETDDEIISSYNRQ